MRLRSTILGRRGHGGWSSPPVELACLIAAFLGAIGAADPLPSAPAVVDLSSHEFAAGWLLDAPREPDPAAVPSLRWQAVGMATAWTFDLNRIQGVRFPGPVGGASSPDLNLWQVELDGGDVLVGQVRSMDDRWLTLTMGPPASEQVVQIRRDSVRSLVRPQVGRVSIWSGGLAGWQTQPNEAGWQADEGGLVGRHRQAKAYRALSGHARMAYEFSWSWEKLPTLRIAVGDSGASKQAGRYRLELSPQGSSAVRQEWNATGRSIAAVNLQMIPLAEQPESDLRLTVYVDQVQGRLVVVGPGDPPVPVEVNLPPVKPGPSPDEAPTEFSGGVMLTLIEGQAKLRRLRITPWVEEEPSGRDPGRSGIVWREGRTEPGTVTAIEAGRVILQPADGSEPVAYALDDVGMLRLSGTAAVAPRRDSPRWVHVADSNGSELVGQWSHVADGRLWLEHPACAGPLGLPVTSLSSLAVLNPARTQPSMPGRLGRFTSDSMMVRGCLVGADNPSGPKLAWMPLGSRHGSPLGRDLLGRPLQAELSYNDLDKGPGAREAVGGIGAAIHREKNGRFVITQLARDQPLRQQGIQDNFVLTAISPNGDGNLVKVTGRPLHEVEYLLYGRVGSPVGLQFEAGQNMTRYATVNRRPLSRVRITLDEVLEMQRKIVRGQAIAVPQREAPTGNLPRLILRNGETLACQVRAIMPEGVIIAMAGDKTASVPHEAIQALKLMQVSSRGIPMDKARRLLTLPRLQRDHPPTHLLRSREGDYLRGRVVSMDDQAVRFELEAAGQAQPLVIARDQIARIIWLHPPRLAPSSDSAPPADAPLPVRSDPGGLPVEGLIQPDGRIHLRAQAVEGDVLIGEHPWLGPVRVDLNVLDRVLIGARPIGADERPYSQWQVEPAPEPRNLPAREDLTFIASEPPRSAWSVFSGAAGPVLHAEADSMLKQSAQLLHQGDRRGLWLLAAVLDAADVQQRREAIARLRAVTRQSEEALPYDANADLGVRMPQTQAWRHWVARSGVTAPLHLAR